MIHKDQLQSIKICLKHQLFDLHWSAWICKDWLAHRQGARSVKGRCHPISCHMHFRDNLQSPVIHKPATSVGSFLTLPKLHLARFTWLEYPDHVCIHIYYCLMVISFFPVKQMIAECKLCEMCSGYGIDTLWRCHEVYLVCS